MFNQYVASETLRLPGASSPVDTSTLTAGALAEHLRCRRLRRSGHIVTHKGIAGAGREHHVQVHQRGRRELDLLGGVRSDAWPQHAAAGLLSETESGAQVGGAVEAAEGRHQLTGSRGLREDDRGRGGAAVVDLRPFPVRRCRHSPRRRGGFALPGTSEHPFSTSSAPPISPVAIHEMSLSRRSVTLTGGGAGISLPLVLSTSATWA
jgi:hypothetical protein